MYIKMHKEHYTGSIPSPSVWNLNVPFMWMRDFWELQFLPSVQKHAGLCQLDTVCEGKELFYLYVVTLSKGLLAFVCLQEVWASDQKFGATVR